MDALGNIYEVGESWICADGCNYCECIGPMTISSTLEVCQDTDQNHEQDNLETDSQTIVVETVWEDIEFLKLENCQRVNTDHDIVHKWSAYGHYVAFTDDDDNQFSLIDVTKNKILKMPNLDRNKPFGICNQCTSIIDMQIYDGNLYFMALSYAGNQSHNDLVRYDIENHTYHILDTVITEVRPNAIPYVYGYFGTDGRYVTAWDGCGVDPFNPVWCLIDLKNMHKQQISNHGRQAFIQNGLVLSSEGTQQTDILLWDLANNRKVEVTHDDSYQIWPHTDGKRIVYMDLKYNTDTYPLNTYSKAVVMLYDLQTRETRQLTTEKWISAFPQIKNDRVAWLDYEHAPGVVIDVDQGVEIHEMDLDTNTKRGIVKMSDVKKIGFAYLGDAVVFSGERAYISDLWHCPIIRD